MLNFSVLVFFAQILRDAETMLGRMDHRGGCACDNDTGDGAGVLTAIPHVLFARVLKLVSFLQKTSINCCNLNSEVFLAHSFNQIITNFTSTGLVLFTRGYISNYREQSNINLPQQGDYATGIIMMGPDIVEKAEQAFNELAEQCDLEVRIKIE